MKLEFKEYPHASHQPILYALASQIKNGKVIEYGCGKYSTGLLHKICEENNNVMYTVENDPYWMSCAKLDYPGFHWHHYVDVKDFTDLLDMRFDFSCDLAFIDSNPWGTRQFAIQNTLASKWRFMVIHDCEFITTGHTEYMDVFQSKNCQVYVHDTLNPPTMVVSNGVSIGLDVDYEKVNI